MLKICYTCTAVENNLLYLKSLNEKILFNFSNVFYLLFKNLLVESIPLHRVLWTLPHIFDGLKTTIVLYRQNYQTDTEKFKQNHIVPSELPDRY
jgi:hypothetical protein